MKATGRKYKGRRAFAAAMRQRRRRALALRRRLHGPSVYSFVESCPAPASTINVASNAQGAGLLTFNFNDLTNASSYKSLFDLYKLDRVTVKIIPWGNVALTGTVGATAVGNAIPVLYIAPNRDYYVPAPSVVGGDADVLNDDGVRVISVSRPTTLTLYKPRAQITNPDGTPLNIGLGIMPNKVTPWLSTGGNAQTVDQSSIKHFGFRWWADNSQNSAPFIPTMIYTYHFSMKERD